MPNETKTVTRDELNNLIAVARGYEIKSGVFEYDGSSSEWTVWHKDGKSYNRVDYTRDIAPAMSLVAEMRKTRYVELHMADFEDGEIFNICEIQDITIPDKTIELAICRTFLYLKTDTWYEVSD